MFSIRKYPGGIAASCLVAALVAGTAVAAEPMNIRPGLWSTRSTTVMSGAPIYVEGMPAANRAEYEKQWAATVNRPLTNEDDEDCITEKDIRQAAMLDSLRKGENCKLTVSKQTSTALAGVAECSEGKTSTRTQFDYRANSPTAFSAEIKTAVTSPNGVTNMNITMGGKWLAASCPAGDDDDYEDDE
jgi:hypothetical protein